jgi:uncharacterized protein (UPF0332 family)
VEKLWFALSESNERSAKKLLEIGEFRPSVTRAYYAAYDLATGLCWQHGDNTQFANGWNNPSHEQLPDLITRNGNLEMSVRRLIAKLLRVLRAAREDAEYRLGRTVNETTARMAIEMLGRIRRALGFNEDS